MICHKCNADIISDYANNKTTFHVQHGYADLVKIQLCQNCVDSIMKAIKTWLKEPVNGK